MNGMSNIVLTVCIPTYNRPEHIKTQVRDVLSQLTSEVRLIVLDNHSDVPVSTYFTQEELDKFQIIRHSTNIGADGNNARCLETAKSGWVWLLGDDDRIRPDAISFILNLIRSNNDSCFINTGNKRDVKCNSFDEFLAYFRVRGTYGKAFFQTACLFNMDKLTKSLIWYYIFISSQMGQFYFVLKHMELNPGESCLFCTDSLIVDKEPPTWNALEIINNSGFIFDKFHYLKKKMKDTIFSSLGNMYFDNLGAAHNISFFERGHYLVLIFKNIGVYNVFRYNFIGISYYIMGRCLPSTLTKSIHKLVSEWYNKSLKHK